MSNTSPKYCLNCNTELHGKYCHVCGQKATQDKPTLKEFIQEYLNIAFVWDKYLIKTLKALICKPGHLTNEYMSGKFISYMHPLKLNMFLLFIFITFFLLFHNADDMGNSIKTLTRDPLVQIELLESNKEYNMKMKASRRDTVRLYANLNVSEMYPEIITNIDDVNISSSDSLTIWTAAVPHQLIEDEILLPHEDGHYYFNADDHKFDNGTHILESVWAQMVGLTTDFFPLIILLTAPFLSLLIRLLQRRGDHSHFKHFIFSLHYTAFLELVIIMLYILHLIASPPSWLMQGLITIGSFTYLTFAFRKVYETKHWAGAISKSILTNMGYAMILMMLFCCIFLIACTIVIIHYVRM